MRTILAMVLFALSYCANAALVPAGDLWGGTFWLDQSSVEHKDDFVAAWVVSPDKKFNFTKDDKYFAFGVHFVLDCKSRKFMVDSLAAMDDHGKKIVGQSVELYYDKALPNTLPSYLFVQLCDVQI
jgi:hypothetical protein